VYQKDELLRKKRALHLVHVCSGWYRIARVMLLNPGRKRKSMMLQILESTSRGKSSIKLGE
jgi:hypothetical protein